MFRSPFDADHPSVAATDEDAARRDTRRGLSLAAGLICVTLIGFDLRPPIVSIGPLLPAIRAMFHLSHAQAALLTTIPDLLMGALALPTPWLARRFGRDRVVLAALVLLLIAMGVRALAGSTASLLLATAGVGAGIAIAGALIGGFIKAAFPDRAAFVMSIYATALAFGATMAAGMSGPVSGLAGGWRSGAGLWALLGIPAIGAWLFVEHRLNRGRATPKMEAAHYRLPLGRSKAWMIALFFAADNFLYYGLVSWISPMYREHGFSVATAGLILASFTGAFLVATPLAGVFSRRPDRRPILAGFAAISLVGLLALVVAPDAAPFVVLPLISFGIAGGFTLGFRSIMRGTRTRRTSGAPSSSPSPISSRQPARCWLVPCGI